MLRRIIVFISGNGSNLQAIIDAIQSGTLECKIDLVVSSKKTAYGLTRAEKAGIPTLVFPLKPYQDAGKTRIEYDVDLANKVKEYNPDLIVLAGWMLILSKEFINHFNDNIINLHPALPGQFDGVNAIQHAYEAFKRGEITKTGVMVHKVIPEVDKGEPLIIEEVPIFESDTLETLEERIHSVEHKVIVQSIKKFLQI
ncbi:phosphoribosylglycinamide formyltransferase [Gigaspora rosea]|uniref:Phosphoribosylglycinamide formyltransferase n=1 Tax=Gigaspora rosea TaxID=44941 RepID=A0A397U910_9GLOM|nr:phosphoribosylglycinamide formyltransferase [Gigaspora rosea]